jgi:hypothetical protein
VNPSRWRRTVAFDFVSTFRRRGVLTRNRGLSASIAAIYQRARFETAASVSNEIFFALSDVKFLINTATTTKGQQSQYDLWNARKELKAT